MADTCLIGPELEFFVFDDVRFDQRGHEAFYHVDSVEGAWNRGRVEQPEPGLQAGLGAGLFPLPADRQPGRPPHRDGPAHGRVRHRDRGPLPRGGHRRPVRDRPGAAAAGRERRPGDAGQVHHPQRRPAQRQDGDLHAQAALRRQRLGHAHPLLALEGRGPAARRQRLRRAQRPGDVRHRRPAQARPGALRLRQPDDQQLQAAGRRASRPRPSSPTAAATARRSSGSRSTAPAPGAGGSSTAAPTARPIPTCSSRPC